MNSERAKIDARASILVVEDAPDLMRLLVRSLETSGYRAVPAPDGERALEVFETDGAIDLLLTDIVMPGSIKGPELAERLRQTRPDLPVIFMSGYAADAAICGDGARPGDIRLSKPARRADLIDAIETALGDDRRLAMSG